MSIKKVTIASLILLSLAACSSGSGSSQHGTEKKSTPSIQESNKQNNSNQASKSEAERLKAEEAARLAKEKAEAERLAKETTIEQKLKDLNVPEKDIKTINDESFSNDQKERFLSAVRRMKELDIEYNYIFAHNHANGSQDRENNTSLEEILRGERAYALGARGNKPSEFAKSYQSYNSNETKEEIDNRLINFLKETLENQYALGLTKNTDKSIYNQKYSITIVKKDDEHINDKNNKIVTRGLTTAKDLIPYEGQATYKGKAFDPHHEGELTYNIDFGSRLGSGQIDKLPDINGIGYSIILDKATMEQSKLSGRANSSNGGLGTYSLELFGPKAEEISGSVQLDKSGIIEKYGLAGTRGEITK